MRRVASGIALALALALGAAGARADDGEDAALVAARAGQRAAIERLAAEGRWEEMDSVLPTGPGAVEAWALELRDRWWRPTDATDRPVLPKGDVTGDVMARRWAWLAAGGEDPHPLPAAGEDDPWPILAALVLDRQRRLDASIATPERLAAPELNRVLRDPPAHADGTTLAALRMGLEKVDWAYDAELDAASEEARQAGQEASTRAWNHALVALAALGVLCLVLTRVPRRRVS
ncbi:MAG: hypothetical protein AB7T63_07750 [Planctomycetota bacterium]